MSRTLLIGPPSRMKLRLTALARADASEVSGWRYDPPYDTYDVSAEDGERMTDPDCRFSGVRDGDELVAYVCLGAEARVKGLEPKAGIEDLGFGLRPDLVGRGLSREILPWTRSALDNQILGDELRVVILDWNERSLAAYRRAGFTDVGSHTNEDGRYLLLTRPRP